MNDISQYKYYFKWFSEGDLKYLEYETNRMMNYHCIILLKYFRNNSECINRVPVGKVQKIYNLTSKYLSNYKIVEIEKDIGNYDQEFENSIEEIEVLY
jgi:hypothetical protein